MSTDGPEPVTVKGVAQVEVNVPVKLECSAPSVPPASYSWTFNGTKTPITTGDYVIDHVTYTNTGTYTCEAYNALTGKTTTNSHFLTVKGRTL